MKNIFLIFVAGIASSVAVMMHDSNVNAGLAFTLGWFSYFVFIMCYKKFN